MAGKRLRPFFSYFGSKWKLAPKYPTPEFDTIVEPFAGSAQYACLYPDRKVYLCDKDPVVVSVWRYLISVAEEEILALPDLPRGVTIRELDIPDAAQRLIGFCVQGGASGGLKQSGSSRMYSKDLESEPAFWGPACRRRIASQLHAIRHWKVANCSYSDIPTSEPATWYVDPPYQVKGAQYRYGAARLDFPALGAWCQSLPGQVIVCENAGADWLPFRPFADVAFRQGGGRVNKEVVWLSSEHR